MRTVSYRLGDLARATINIGKVAENEYTRVQFNAEQIFAEYPAATAALNVINPAGTAYPAVVTREGDLIIWDVTDADLTAEGMGELQLTLTENGVVCKSYIARTRIERSIVASGSTPDPVQNWLDQAAEVLEEVQEAIPAGGTQGQVLGKLSDDDYDMGWIDQTGGGGGGGGTSNYNELSNKPQIAGTTLSGNKTLAQLGIAAAADIPDVSGFYTKPASGIPAADLASGVIPDVSGFYTKPASGIPASDLASGVIPDVSGFYTKPAGGIPKSDLASGVQTSLGKADTAYQKPAGGIPATDLASGVIPDVSGFYTKPAGGIPASDIASGVIPDPEDLIDDTAGDGDTDKVWSADKTAALSSAIAKVTPEQFGAKGDGTTDDSEAVQAACDAGYEVRFSDNKTYYLASTVTIDHDVHLVGGENTKIKTITPDGGEAPNAIIINGTLKKTTTITSDYTSKTSASDNSSNKFTFSDMTGINIGDILVFSATDQYFNYSRRYNYIGGTLMVSDVYDGHIYTSENLPFDITATENVSVKVYSAPVVIVENLHFESDLDSIGSYSYLLTLSECKNSVIKNCTFDNMSNGVMLFYCFNTCVENVMLAKSKYDNTLPHDGYGVYVGSCTNTIFERVTAICAQHAIAVTGYEPSINTFVRNCDLLAECRNAGLNAHESNYNMVIEDCVLGGASLCGNITVNRCRFIKNERPGTDNYLIMRGSHNPAWANLMVSDCTFDCGGIYITDSSPQQPIQAFDSVIGRIEVDHCEGGMVLYNPALDATILSDTINEFIIKNWKDCFRIKNPGTGKIKRLIIRDSNFTNVYFINNVSEALELTGIERIDIQRTTPAEHKLYVNEVIRSYRYVLPKDVTINLSSNNNSAKFRVCGINLAPNVLDDFQVGNVSGNAGSALVRTAYSGVDASLSVDANGNPVYTQGGNTKRHDFYPVGLYYVDTMSTVVVSATLKNTGATNGESFRPYLVMIDTETGLVTKRKAGSEYAASAGGTAASYTYDAAPGEAVLMYFSCSTAVENAVTTFENLSMTITPKFAAPVADYDYASVRRTGNGSVKSLEGVNNIMSSEDTFTVSFGADLVNNPI